MSGTSQLFLPPEWYPQDAILLVWPNENTDWRYNLKEVKETYKDIIKVVSEYQKVIVVCQIESVVKKELFGFNLENIIFFQAEYNDTWARDSGPITIYKDNSPVLVDFGFNGWGGKYDARLDNQLTYKLYSSGILEENVVYINCQNFVLEGGSIDADGNGTLLTTSKCLLSKQRNPNFSKQEIEKKLIENLGIRKVQWLNYGEIDGDDTDGHIDTLAKFCNEKTIAYASCEEKNDPHFIQLKKMEEEIKELRNINSESYELIKLPLPEPIYNSENKRLPATYVNFLITNEVVLLPSYRNKKDNEAKDILQNIFIDKKVLLIDCVSLIQQFGSLHCITMQFPKTTLKI